LCRTSKSSSTLCDARRNCFSVIGLDGQPEVITNAQPATAWAGELHHLHLGTKTYITPGWKQIQEKTSLTKIKQQQLDRMLRNEF